MKYFVFSDVVSFHIFLDQKRRKKRLKKVFCCYSLKLVDTLRGYLPIFASLSFSFVNILLDHSHNISNNVKLEGLNYSFCFLAKVQKLAQLCKADATFASCCIFYNGIFCTSVYSFAYVSFL